MSCLVRGSIKHYCQEEAVVPACLVRLKLSAFWTANCMQLLEPVWMHRSLSTEAVVGWNAFGGI